MSRSREPNTRTRIKFLRILFVAAGLLFLSGISVLFGMMMAVAPQVKRLSNNTEFKTAQNSTLTDREGNFLAELTSDEGRVILQAKDIAPVMKQAVVAIEDKRFYQHKGVDLRGVGRALVRDVTAGGAVEGASTIEQQFIKVVSKAQDERTYSAKIREIALAYHLSHKWSKSKVITEYLNSIYYGNGAYGIESAARTYFRTDGEFQDCGTRKDPCAKHLRPAQAAFLAGIINSPTMYDPVTNPIKAQQRRDLVLRNMRAQGMLDPVAYADALAEPIPAPESVQPPRVRISTEGSGYYVGWISAQLTEMLGPRTAFEGGLTVKTTLDPKLQKSAEDSIGAWLSGIGPSAAMVAIDNGTGEVRAMVGGQDFNNKPFNLATQGRRQPGSSFKPFILAEAIRDGISPNSTWESRKREFTISKKTGEKFTVNNYDDNYSGITTLANATAFSDNAVFAQVGIKVGTKKVAKLAREMGVRTPVSSNLAMTLGGLKTGVTPLDMAHSYETFATGGKRMWGTLGAPNEGPIGIKSYKPKDKNNPDAVKETDNELREKRVIPDGVARQTMGVLTGVVRVGSGKVAAIPGHTVWGKTGTTEDYGDAWFVGSTEDLTVAVWVGYADETKPMLTEYRGEAVAGGTYPAQIWHTFMLKALDIEAARRDKVCEQKAKTKNPCKEDVKPTTPEIDESLGGTGSSGSAGTTPSSGTAGS
ncbi:MAG: transglycosylase domain-containing protein, partial [Solirubrobacteraceae bacterium]|nr:transglycosylase domain-containing protein [Solirubrobacteraceae bacterium]